MTTLARILVVDDQESVCTSASKILLRKGYRVDCSLDAEEALERIKGVPYHIIILDIMMPKINGIDLLRTIRQRHRECNVIMITGYASIKTAVESTQLGSLAYIAKPFTPQELLEAVEQVLRENPRPDSFCEKGRMECRLFPKKGPCKDECVIKTKGGKRDDLSADELAAARVNIDVDMPFDFDEVEEATSDISALTMSRSDIPILGWRKYYERSDRILVVDDEVVICNSIRKILAQKEYDVDSATSADEAAGLLSQQRYGLVLLDLRLPNASGMELLRRIRSEWPDVKVVVVTGYASLESAVEATRLGATNYIAKPFTPDELRTAVDAAMGRQAA